MLRSLYRFLLLSTLFLSGCSKKESPPEESPKEGITFNLPSIPESLHPHLGGDLASAILHRMLFEGLTRISPEGQPTPALAKRIDVDEGAQRYVFHLRDSVWSDGQPLTAEDFEYSWKHVLRPESTAPNTDQLYIIKNAREVKQGLLPPTALGVVARDAHRLEVELERPSGSFPELVSTPIFFPIPRAAEERGADWAEWGAVGNGPFSLVFSAKKDEILMERNELYWDVSEVKISHVTLTMADPATELMLYESGTLDWAGSPLGQLPLELLSKEKPCKNLCLKTAAATEFLRFHVEAEPFTNSKIRRAFSLAIDREALVEHVMQGAQQAAKGLIPPLLGWEARSHFNDHAVEEARRLLQEGLVEAKLSKKDLSKVTLMYSKADWKHEIAQALQQQWKEALGVEIKLQRYEWKVFLQKLKACDYQVSMSNWFADLSDPINFLELFESREGGNNRTHWFQPSYTALVEKAKTCVDRNMRENYLREAEALLMQEMPIAPLFFYGFAYMKNPQLSGVYFSNLGYVDFKYAFREEKK